MPARRRTLNLSLGMQTVGLAEFETGSDGGLVLVAFETTELVADPAADATRAGQLQIAMSELREKVSPKGGKVNYAISAHWVFTRFVKLPSVGQEKVDQIVTFEAQQNVPFPISEVVWDYQLVGGNEAGKMEVVLVAIKSDLLNELNEAVEEAGFTAGIVDVSPMALYNAYRYNYSDVEDCALLIDIGARTTNLIFIEPRKVFSRSIPIGGNTITVAEQRNKQHGFVSLGGSYAEPSDPDVARVSKMVRNPMARLHAEIFRSIGFYRSQQQGSAPARIYLSGGGSGMPYMRQFFGERLQMPVEFFNSLRNVAVAQGVDVDYAAKQAHTMGELVGLALRATNECPMELNLRPASVARRQEIAKRRPYLIAASVCLLLVLTGWWLYYLKAAEVGEAVLAQLTAEINGLKGFEGRFQAARKQIQDALQTAAPLIQAVNQRDYWVKVINDLSKRLPQRFIWITLMEPGYFAEDGRFTSLAPGARERGEPPPSSPGEKGKSMPGLQVAGLYLDNPNQANVIDDFVKNLAASPYFDIDLNQRTWFNPVRATPTDTEWAYPFELRLKLKNPPFGR